MSKSPLLNAIGAELYILVVVGVLSLGAKMKIGQNSFFLAPLLMISMFTLSAAMMAYIFCLQPIQMYLDGKKKEAVNLFLKTVLYFGILTVVLLGLMFGRILK